MFKDALQPGISLGDRFNYLFQPPGWSHDGSRQMSKDIKAEYVALNPSEAGKPGLGG